MFKGFLGIIAETQASRSRRLQIAVVDQIMARFTPIESGKHIFGAAALTMQHRVTPAPLVADRLAVPKHQCSLDNLDTENKRPAPMLPGSPEEPNLGNLDTLAALPYPPFFVASIVSIMRDQNAPRRQAIQRTSWTSSAGPAGCMQVGRQA
jgi:hypothetical protein